jgi:hypothetical protein
MDLNRPELLAIYLNDHFAGATAGRDLARRTARSNRETSHGPFLLQLSQEIDEDRQSLQRIMEALEVRVDPVKVGAAWLGEKLSRLKLNGRLREYSPMSRVVELEGLAIGVSGKGAGWRTLKVLRTELAALEAFDLDELERRADAQLEQLEEHRLAAVAEAFPDP